jgi:sigma-B regulation protein RsbQ
VAPLDPITKNNVQVVGNPGSARTIVFVHGFGTDQRAWHAVVGPFLKDFRIVLLDNVGAGGSAPDAFVQHRYLNLHAYATDLLDVCRALQIEDAVLVAHSVGAMIGVLAANAEPARFSRLVLIGASPRYLDEPGYRGGFTKPDLDALYSAVSSVYPDWADQFAPLAMGNPDRPQLAQHFAATLKSIPAQSAFTVLCSIFQSDHRQDVCKLDKPTLLIQSQQDVAVPLEVAEYLNREIRGSRLAVIDATGHLPHVSAPAAVVAAMRDFIGGATLE